MPEQTLSRPTKRQQELFEFIDTFITSHGYGPSYREIMRALDYKSVSTVAIHVNQLLIKGYIRKRTRAARSLEVVYRATSSGVSAPAQHSGERWLIDRVEAYFQDYATAPSDKKRDDLFVLVGALHVLGLHDMTAIYKARLPKG